MKKIKLVEKSEDGTILDTLEGELSASALSTLKNYIKYFERVMECSLIERGIPQITEISLKNGCINIKASQVSDGELYEFLHVLRPLILHKEPSSFSSVRSTLGRYFQSKRLSLRMKSLQHIYDNGQLAGYMQISIGDQKLFDPSTLSTWLNGTQYHTEEVKAEKWGSLEKSLSNEGSRALVINQLKDKLYAIQELAEIVYIILEANQDPE